jgi:acetyl-CoA C-acetyltransferase|tara:strand:- start:346 stop:1542 length:1197 start_codon:yes stop_codon:yes gene_type:complete
MGSSDIVIAGVGMVPFAKPGRSPAYDVMGEQAARLALTDAGINYALVEQAVCGYVYGDSCSGQAALYRVGINGIPIFNVNNNCASGSSAFALAVQAIESGNVDCALALGFEQMNPGAIDDIFPDKTSPLARFESAIAHIMCLSDAEQEAPPAICMFGAQVDALLELGVSEETLAAVAVKSRLHAARNEKAIFREPLSVEEILATPPIFRKLRKNYACPPSCGAAAVVVCTDDFARANGIRADVRLVGRGWASDRKEYFSGSALDVMFQALSRDAASAAYEDAGVGPEDVDVIELHDCFTSNELATYVALGLCSAEQLNEFVASGQATYGGRWVVNPSGGLLAKGHPLGATGLAQITELTLQLRGEAGSRQVQGARFALQHNGGLGSAGFVHILANAQA